MTEEIKSTELPVAAAAEVEPTKLEKVEAPAPEHPVETLTVTAQEEAPPVAKSEESAPTETAPAEPVLPELTNAQWGKISQPLATIYRKLPEILEKSGHAEVFGVTLVHDAVSTEPAFSTLLILQKFIRANSNNVEKAVDQLTATLEWRKKQKPLESLDAEYDRSAFEGLGYVQVLGSASEVVTWNIYGAVKDYKKTFGNLEAFLKWRVALMEAAIAKLNLSTATKPIPDFGKGEDSYQIAQIHDYLNVSFLRMDPDAKAASKAAPVIFRDFYPEMLSRKFFVNVPLVMGWLYKATTLVLSEATVKKFRVLSYGKELHAELGEDVPEIYGGKGVKELKDLGDPVKLTTHEEAPALVEQTAAPVPDAAPNPTA
ncbi:hypothetical protein H072_1820 [Dactylellina haptotyla CBS 200.50]|uniref:Phosphatidylinositol transfer protein SFH5 n=1 Tax=Dactylellina haptotyla (strain CBS 200.50) TaxID=1284197 RepID=S8BX87_DACHA|nr:hypothetical protein H072_1820 [Dactylellina haptotyla CBS 200.50]